jgi:3-oxoacyl-[acyl-carrier protein] reductase
MDLQLRDKSVLITGAAGGIGRALASVFAEEGARLALHAFNQFDSLTTWIRDRGWTDRAVAVRADVRLADKIDAAVEEAAESLGRLDVVIVNAGIWPSEDVPLVDMPEERLRDTLEVNLVGGIWTARAFLRCLARTGPRPDGHGASIVFIGSTAGRFGEAGHVDYAVSKGALRGLIRTLKNEIVHIDPFGRVNLVEPGWTATPMSKASLDQPGVIEGALATTPIRRIARAEDVARVVAMVASPASGHVTGEVITVSGGMEGRVQWTAEEVDAAAIRARLG